MRTTTEELLATAEQLAQIGSWVQELPSEEGTWSDGLFAILGIGPGSVPVTLDSLLERAHPDDRENLRTYVRGIQADPAAVPADGAVAEFRIVRPDGSVRFVTVRGRTEPDGDGWRFFGAAQDVTDVRLTERDLQAHYGVSQALREWESFEEGVVVLLRRLGTALDYPIGALWTPDPSGEYIVCRALWCGGHLELREFEDVTRALRFRRGEPILGRVWEDLRPTVVPDTQADPYFKRADVALAAGVRSALLLPVPDGDGPLAVLSFYALDRREESERLLRTLAGIGAELGQFLGRRRAQLQPSPLSPRELEVLQLAAEGCSGPEIATRLVVSPSTIKTHFENIYEKLGVSDRAGAVAHALRIGLVR